MNRKMLIVEDSPALQGFLAHVAERLGLEPLRAANGEQALARFAAEQPDLVVLDVGLPDTDGFAVARAMRAAEPRDHWTPIIFLTALDSDEAMVEGIAAGGDDYLVKPVSDLRLAAKIEALRRLSDTRRELVETQARLREANERLELVAASDGLTGLSNRRHFDLHLQREWRHAVREGGPVSLLMLDVDHFKLFNDTYGHPAGDRCLQRVASVLAAEARRPGDLAARYGGEEFVVLLPGTDEEGARIVARRLAAGLHRQALPHAASAVAPVVTASIGIATLEPGHADGEPESLVALADDALYLAKADGRNRARVAPRRGPSQAERAA